MVATARLRYSAVVIARAMATARGSCRDGSGKRVVSGATASQPANENISVAAAVPTDSQPCGANGVQWPARAAVADPSRQLPRAVAIALAVTTALYLSLAVATISVLGPAAATDVPLAGLLSHAIGTVGPDAAALAAIVLTLGATNAYISGAAAMAGELAHAASGSQPSESSGRPSNGGGHAPAPLLRLLAAIAAAGLLLIAAYGLRIVSTAALVAVPTVLFLTVYLGAMAAAARVLHGPARLAALPAALAVTVMLGFCGWALAIPAAVALVTTRRIPRRVRPALLPAEVTSCLR